MFEIMINEDSPAVNWIRENRQQFNEMSPERQVALIQYVNEMITIINRNEEVHSCGRETCFPSN